MTCAETRDLFSALADDALAPSERVALDDHLAGCPECRRELAALLRTVKLVRAIDPAHAPAGFVHRVLAAARPTPWPTRLARRLAPPWPALPLGAAALLVMGGLAVLLFRAAPEQQRAAQSPTPPRRVPRLRRRVLRPPRRARRRLRHHARTNRSSRRRRPTSVRTHGLPPARRRRAQSRLGRWPIGRRQRRRASPRIERPSVNLPIALRRKTLLSRKRRPRRKTASSDWRRRAQPRRRWRKVRSGRVRAGRRTPAPAPPPRRSRPRRRCRRSRARAR